jgi:hypothetical protein
MSFRTLKFSLILAAAVGFAGVVPAAAEEQAGDTGYRNSMRLGGSQSLYAACRGGVIPNCIRDAKALKRMAANKAFQKNLSAVMDQAGLTKLTAQVMQALTDADPNVVKATDFAVGDTMEWMGYYKAGKPALLRQLRWGGGKPAKPFGAFEFAIEDGPQVYNFVLPKACGNLALRSITQKALPECVMIETQRDCDKKTMSLRASGKSVSSGELTKIEVSRGGSKVADLLTEQGNKFSGPLTPGRYTFKAFDKYGREVPICQGKSEAVIEDCAAPPPPPPPPPIACGVKATAVKGKGGYDVTLDASASSKGGSAVKSVTLEIVGPAGTVVPFTYKGKVQNSITLDPPFQANVFVAKPLPGVYRVRGKCEPENPKVAGANCEDTFEILAAPAPRFFADGTFGKQRRQYDLEDAHGVGVSPGFCDPQLVFKAGPLFWLAEGKASLAPALGVAFQFGDLGDYDFDPNEYNSVSVLAEAVINYHFKPYGAYIGTGFGWWDIFDTDHNTGAWVVNFGVPMKSTDKGTLLFIGEGRLFFSNNEQSSNYNIGAGIRYEFKK